MAVRINQESIKELLLAKGDKIALGVGGGAAALLLVWGVVSAASAPSPAATAKKLEGEATRVKSGVQSPGENAAALPKWVVGTKDAFPAIDATQFAAAPHARPFEPVYQPNLLAENPQVRGVDPRFIQLDVIRLPYKAFDIQEGEGGERKIGVLKDKKADTKDVARVAQALQQAQQQLNRPQRNQRPGQPGAQPPRPGQGQPPGFGQPPGGFPGGGQPPGGGFPGGPGGGRPGGGFGQQPGGPGGGSPDGGEGGMPGGMGGYGMGPGAARTDATVEYVNADEVARGQFQLAQSVAPLRAVMVHGLIPLREQREEYMRALKVRPDRDGTGKLTFANVPPVRYDGFDVQRRVIGPDGRANDWADYDHVEQFFTQVRARAVEFTQEQGYFGRFFRYEDQLVHPLPVVADALAKYPDVKLKPIDDAVEEMKKAGIPPVTPTDWERRLGKPDPKNGNPLDPRTAGGGGQGSFGGMGYGGPGGPGGRSGMGMQPGGPGGNFGPPGGMPGGPGGAMMPGRGGPGGAMQPPGGGAGSPDGGPPGGPGGMMGPGGFAGYQQQEPDFLLLRFLDVDVRPGFSYQYRVRLKLQNPNYGKKTGVGRKSDAALQTIEGRWQELPEQITLPPETQFYAIDPQKYLADFKKFHKDHGEEYALKRLAEVEPLEAGKRAAVQVQQWRPSVRIDGTTKQEPIGTWVVADLPVAPGEYVGKRTLVELPLWSAGLANYVLRELAGGVKVTGIRNPQNQPKGWPIGFRTPDVLVDFDGGRQVRRVGDRNISDDAAQELLIVRPDGKLVVKNSAEDLADKTREDRNTVWSQWLERVKARGTQAAGPAGPGGPGGPGGGGFNRP